MTLQKVCVLMEMIQETEMNRKYGRKTLQSQYGMGTVARVEGLTLTGVNTFHPE